MGVEVGETLGVDSDIPDKKLIAAHCYDSRASELVRRVSIIILFWTPVHRLRRIIMERTLMELGLGSLMFFKDTTKSKACSGNIGHKTFYFPCPDGAHISKHLIQTYQTFANILRISLYLDNMSERCGGVSRGEDVLDSPPICLVHHTHTNLVQRG